MASRSLDKSVQEKVNLLINLSIKYAFENPTSSINYTKLHCQEMDDVVSMKIEDNVRVTMSNTDTRNTNKTGFINNTNTTVSATDVSTNVPERVALSKLLKQQADN